ncbi:MAG: hypothetical protein JWM49_1630 [Microbacteriaceae bacterium]|nr:hypothetical protein [Microbacteriaceae bacterium]
MRRYLPWIGALVILIVFTLMTYGVMQQIERQGANDGPLRLASEVSSELARGSGTTIDAMPRVDLSNSLAPFVVVFGVDGKPSSGNGYLHGALASPPSGVISTARKAGQGSVTWQPSTGLRFATVSIRSGDRVVMAGQSLAPSEHRTESIGTIIAMGGLGAVLILVLTFASWELFRRRE